MSKKKKLFRDLINWDLETFSKYYEFARDNIIKYALGEIDSNVNTFPFFSLATGRDLIGEKFEFLRDPKNNLVNYSKIDFPKEWFNDFPIKLIQNYMETYYTGNIKKKHKKLKSKFKLSLETSWNKVNECYLTKALIDVFVKRDIESLGAIDAIPKKIEQNLSLLKDFDLLCYISEGQNGYLTEKQYEQLVKEDFESMMRSLKQNPYFLKLEEKRESFMSKASFYVYSHYLGVYFLLQTLQALSKCTDMKDYYRKIKSTFNRINRLLRKEKGCIERAFTSLGRGEFTGEEKTVKIAEKIENYVSELRDLLLKVWKCLKGLYSDASKIDNITLNEVLTKVFLSPSDDLKNQYIAFFRNFIDTLINTVGMFTMDMDIYTIVLEKYTDILKALGDVNK